MATPQQKKEAFFELVWIAGANGEGQKRFCDEAGISTINTLWHWDEIPPTDKAALRAVMVDYLHILTGPKAAA